MRRHLSSLRSEVRAGLAERVSTIGPLLRTLTMLAVSMVAIYIVAAMVLVPSDEPQNYHFVSERGAVTVLSGILLAMGSGFGFVSFLLTEGSTRRVRWFWFLVAAALGFLAMDELLRFHEAAGSVLDDIDPLGLKESGTVRGWNDVVVIAYGVAALPVVVMFLPTMASVPAFPELGAVAFGCYVVHTAIDALVEAPTTTSVVLEESAKLFAGLFLALASLAGALSCARGEAGS